jgi:IclR family pca regulon transcriptional regulator
VLLAGLPDAVLEERLARIDVRPLTPRTVRDRGALLRVLHEVRRQGFAVVDQELEQGLRSAAVPLHDASGAVVAALNVLVHASRASMAELRSRFVPRAQEAAAAVDAELRRSGIRVGGARGM